MGYLSTDKKKITTKTFAEMKQAGEKFTVPFLVSWWCMV